MLCLPSSFRSSAAKDLNQVLLQHFWQLRVHICQTLFQFASVRYSTAAVTSLASGLPTARWVITYIKKKNTHNKGKKLLVERILPQKRVLLKAKQIGNQYDASADTKQCLLDDLWSTRVNGKQPAFNASRQKRVSRVPQRCGWGNPGKREALNASNASWRNGCICSKIITTKLPNRKN